MALLFCEGVAKNGPVGAQILNISATEWSSKLRDLSTSGFGATDISITVASPLAGTSGASFKFSARASSGYFAQGSLLKILSANYSRLLGYCRISTDPAHANPGVTFKDGATTQCSLYIQATTGLIKLRRGTMSAGTDIAVSSASVAAGSVHFLAWDISFGASATYNIYLDGVLVLTGTGNTISSANSYANTFGLSLLGDSSGSEGIAYFGDIVVMDTSGAALNALPATQPYIATKLPASDVAVAFAVGAFTQDIVPLNTLSTNTNGNIANNINVRAMVPVVSGPLSAICLVGGPSGNATAKITVAVYADASGVPGALLASSAEVVGITANTPLVVPLSSPLSVVAGTKYWLAMMTDTAIYQYYSSWAAGGGHTTRTYTSGLPNPFGTLSTSPTPLIIWGVMTAAPSHAAVLENGPLAPSLNYLTDGTVGDEDLYAAAAMSPLPATVLAVAVKALCMRSDAGARTVDIEMKSGGVTGSGSAPGQTPLTGFSFLQSVFATDPNTGAAWTPAALDAASFGAKVAS